MDREKVRDLLSRKDVSNTKKLLICLAAGGPAAMQVKDVRAIAVAVGERSAKKWNVSSLLQAAVGRAVLTDDGWELTSGGADEVAELVGETTKAPPVNPADSLREHVDAISSKEAQDFVSEAIGCYEAGHLRGAVVLSWVGAVAVLYDHVLAHHLSAFNTEAVSRTSKSKYPWQPAKNADGLAKMKEAEFLIILEKLSIIGKNVKTELGKCLDLRNGCGHPNSLKIGHHVVASHIEVLALNVFAKF